MEGKRLATAAVICGVLGGCANGPQGGLASSAPPTAVASVAPELESGRSVAIIPWQLTPASTASRAQGEVTEVKDVPGYGMVRGTTKALANLERKMVPYPAPRKAVDACEKILAPQAIKDGAYSVEAAPAGPVMRVGRNKDKQQVLFRILYRTPEGIELRQHALSCTTSGDKLVSAQPV